MSHAVDDVPTYTIERNGKQQNAHRARLLLWLSQEDEPALRINLGTISTGDTGTDPMDQSNEDDDGIVPMIMCYGMNLAEFTSEQDPLELWTGHTGPAVCTATPPDETGQKADDGYGNDTTETKVNQKEGDAPT